MPTLADYVALKLDIERLTTELDQMKEEMYLQLREAGGNVIQDGCRLTAYVRSNYEYSPLVTAAALGIKRLKAAERTDGTATLNYETPCIRVTRL